jgi:ATP-dependent RNA helicase DeaD
MRPGDIVGAIVNEAGIVASDIGTIDIGDTFSLVELPEAVADKVITALRATKVKGKKLTVRRDKAKTRR